MMMEENPAPVTLRSRNVAARFFTRPGPAIPNQAEKHCMVDVEMVMLI